MPRIDIDDVRAWVESNKLNPQALNLAHLDQLETEILARISTIYSTTTWVDKSTTPRLVQVIITKMYAGWLYDKVYSENQDERNSYAEMLKENAELLIDGILDGTIEIPGVTPTTPQTPSFYPNDDSSAQEPTFEDPSLGPARFSMGKMF